MEFDPFLQWRYHRKMSWFWLMNFPLVIILFFGFPHFWIAVGLLVNTCYSLYANFDTEYDGVHSSYAAWKSGIMEGQTTNDRLAEMMEENTRLTQEIQKVTATLHDHLGLSGEGLLKGLDKVVGPEGLGQEKGSP